MAEAPPRSRSAYRHFVAIPTRWMDNDVYGHVNNVTYYSYFDTAVNAHLIAAGGLDPARDEVVGYVVETSCRFHQSLSFPQVVDAGLVVARVGNSSVTYAIGLFAEGATEPAASGHFVHVWVDRATQRPAPIPASIRAALVAIAIA
jgi:acyl-CoA thioester hydrolase